MGTLASRAAADRRPTSRRRRASTSTRTCRPASSRSCGTSSAGTCSSSSRTTDLRRAPDASTISRALELGRTLITLDRDFCDDRRFPPASQSRRHRLLRARRAGADAAAAARRSIAASRAGAAGDCRCAAARSSSRRACSPMTVRPPMMPAPIAAQFPVRRQPRAARSRRVGPDARASRAIGSSTSSAGRARPDRARSASTSTATSSCPASSTCTSTASRGRTCSTTRRAVATVAERLPRWGVTAFCPTSVACPPDGARSVSRRGRPCCARRRRTAGARVLPAHLESNFINPEFRGAQPVACLRVPADRRRGRRAPLQTRPVTSRRDFTARDILEVIEAPPRRHRRSSRWRPSSPAVSTSRARSSPAAFASRSGTRRATFEEAQEAIGAGARQATHLFNRMRPMTHRDPGLVGAVLASDEVAAELICDGHHVHPAVMRLAIAAKGPSRTMAITDGTAGSGLPPGAKANLGGQPITVSDVARLDDGTMAGSVLTMDRAFAGLVTSCGFDLVQAAEMCATTAGPRARPRRPRRDRARRDRGFDGARFARCRWCRRGLAADWRIRVWQG